MSLASRYDANSDCMLVIATHVMSWLNISITCKLLTKLLLEMCAHSKLSRWSHQGIVCVFNKQM